MSVIKKSSVLVAVFLGMFVGSARAQGIMTVRVPFPFVVGHEECPAGQYDVRAVNEAGSVISIAGTNNTTATFTLTIAAAGGNPAGDQPALVFTPHENERRLSQIWMSNSEGREIPGPTVTRRIGRAETKPGPSEALAYVIDAHWK